MQFITEEIERALEGQLYYLAVSGSLALPDICAALESEDSRTSPERYKTWYGTWLVSKYPEITADDIYCLRCGVIHEGTFSHKGLRYRGIKFSLPGSTTAHRNMLDHAGILYLNLDAVTFCRDVIASVREWYASKKTDPVVKANMPKLVQPYADGLLPFIKGVPVIS